MGVFFLKKKKKEAFAYAWLMWTVWKRQDVSLIQQTAIEHLQGRTLCWDREDLKNELNLTPVLKFAMSYIPCYKASAWIMVETPCFLNRLK